MANSDVVELPSPVMTVFKGAHVDGDAGVKVVAFGAELRRGVCVCEGSE